MSISIDTKTYQIRSDVTSTQTARIPLNITLCPPELRILERVMKGEIADATFIIQAYIADGLQNRGHRLKFLGPYYSESPIYWGGLDKLETARLTWTGSRAFGLIRKVIWQIQRTIGIPYLNIFSNLRLLDACLQTLPGNNLVYERSTMYRFGVAMACKRLGIPYILYVEADDILEHDIMKKPITGLLRLQMARAFRYNLDTADRVICVSKHLKTHLVEKWKTPREKIVVFPNVADIQRFKPDPQAREDLRASLGVGEVPLIVFVGNFYEWHDITTLLKAFVSVLSDHPEARLMLVGDGVKRNAMMQLATKLGIERFVIFTGMVAHMDVPRFMAAADIAMVPYPVLEQDIWLSPLKLFEYMATGSAIIASNVGQLSEWIQDGWNGMLVTPGDVSEMSAGINRLIENPKLRQQLGQHARDEAVQQHSWDRYLTDLEDVFYSVTDSREVH